MNRYGEGFGWLGCGVGVGIIDHFLSYLAHSSPIPKDGGGGGSGEGDEKI